MDRHHTVDTLGQSSLMQTIQNGDLAQVQRLVAVDNPEAKHLLVTTQLAATTEQLGQTALHVACLYGNVPIFQALLDVMPDVNVRDKAGATALHYAITTRREGVISALMAAPGVDINAVDEAGNTLLMYACYCNNVALVQTLLAGPRRLSFTQYNHAGLSALHIAAQRGFSSCIQELLDANIFGVNATTLDGRTCLMLVKNAVETAGMLLRYPGIDVNLASEDGNTALLHACLGGHDDMIAYLLSLRSVDVNVTNASGDSAFRFAVRTENAFLAAQIVQTTSFDEEHVTPECGPIALSVACALQRVGLVRRLVASPHTDYNYKDKNGLTVLLQVCLSPSTDLTILNILLALPNVDTNATDMRGNSCLMVAVRNDRVDLVRALLAVEATNFNFANEKGDTALTIACEQANYPIAEVLVALPTLDVNHRRKDNRPAYRVARKKGVRKIMQLLTTHPAFEMPPDADEDAIGDHDWTLRGCLREVGAFFLILGQICQPCAWCCFGYAISD
ncbi:hypothetical protein SDRG_10083 [Saprolegnia diclina VS20]|uniref:Uncharacterized protein n=1 Tax=Saprolegnia diclina (strain VS20) TaxID=1156394 RepID=T0QCA3_SAPDV|nr:hypothetical protein SDRG_10083 [Saprolegnia diclina VS20]EQC32336.1 hypothetical protein SDRG_10083 [Saprolegnia diclina VS20]|eukprot:XP_008614277.1 hypothetical protein SDRG_10083 [Saprolegnia diclina VS20]